jgi:hypothetical protein
MTNEVYGSFFKLTEDDIKQMDVLIEKRLAQFTFPGCHRASLENFMDTGRISGTLRTEMHALLMEFAQSKNTPGIVVSNGITSTEDPFKEKGQV